jgi:hypothetical protein
MTQNVTLPGLKGRQKSAIVGESPFILLPIEDIQVAPVASKMANESVQHFVRGHDSQRARSEYQCAWIEPRHTDFDCHGEHLTGEIAGRVVPGRRW